MVQGSGVLTLTPRQANAFTLRRQHLAEPIAHPSAALRSLVAVQAQYAMGVSVALWARSVVFDAGFVDQALLQTRDLAKTWCL